LIKKGQDIAQRHLENRFHLSERHRLSPTIMGLLQVLGSGGDRYWWIWIFGRTEPQSETGAESAIIDGATNLKQQIGVASRPTHLLGFSVCL
jgi:hypothetical protein